MSDLGTVDREDLRGGGAGPAAPAASIVQVAADTARTVQDELAEVAADVREQASDQFEQQRARATKAMTDFAAAIRKAGEELSQHDQSLAAKMIKQAADGLEGVSRSLSDKQPDELLDAARAFGRDNPVAFGAAAVLAGLAVGRFLRSSEGHRPPSSAPSPPAFAPGGMASAGFGPATGGAGPGVPFTPSAPSQDTPAAAEARAADATAPGPNPDAAWRG